MPLPEDRSPHSSSLRIRSALAVMALAAACGDALGASANAGPLASSSAGPLANAPLCAGADAASVPPTWQVVPGSKVPSPIMATAVRGRMPGFAELDVVYVLAFVNFDQPLSRQALPALDRLQTEHGKKVAVVAITDQGPDDARAFVESSQWAPKIGFVVAADPQRSAFRTFFGPQRAPELPQVFIMRNGVVQWTGAAEELSDSVAMIVRGTWDLAAAKRAVEQRDLWKKVLENVEQLAAAKRFDDALKALQDACESAIGEQKGQCLGVRFSLLLRADRVADALAVGEQILSAPLNGKQPAGLAWTLISYAPTDSAAKQFALKAALASDAATRGRDAMVAAILARVQFVNGQRSQAVETARRALSIAESPDLRDAIRDDLKRYEAAAAPSGAPGATPGGSAPSGK